MDDRIIKLARKGDEEAFSQFIKFYKKDLYVVAYRFYHNEHDALEAIQETTYRAYKSIRQLREASSAKAWLTRILANYCLNEIRKNKKLVQEEWHFDQEEKAPLDWVDRHTVKEHIFKLKKNTQKVIILKYFQDYTIKEISNILNKPESTIKTWLYKGLNQMRANMEKEGVTDGR